MDFYEKSKRRQELKEAENEDRVADSLEVRENLLTQVKNGNITLDESKKILARIKKDAKKNGKITRNQAYNGY